MKDQRSFVVPKRNPRSANGQIRTSEAIQHRIQAKFFHENNYRLVRYEHLPEFDALFLMGIRARHTLLEGAPVRGNTASYTRVDNSARGEHEALRRGRGGHRERSRRNSPR
jgi:hypothetical protein